MPRAASIPADWHPCGDDQAFAEQLGLDIAAVVTRFRDTFLANGARLVDWSAQWRIWCSEDAAKPRLAQNTPAAPAGKDRIFFQAYHRKLEAGQDVAKDLRMMRELASDALRLVEQQRGVHGREQGVKTQSGNFELRGTEMRAADADSTSAEIPDEEEGDSLASCGSVVIRGTGDMAWKIEHPESGGFFQALADSDSISDPPPMAVLADEIHEFKSADAIDLWSAAITKVPGDPMMLLGTNTSAADQVVGTE